MHLTVSPNAGISELQTFVWGTANERNSSGLISMDHDLILPWKLTTDSLPYVNVDNVNASGWLSVLVDSEAFVRRRKKFRMHTGVSRKGKSRHRRRRKKGRKTSSGRRRRGRRRRRRKLGGRWRRRRKKYTIIRGPRGPPGPPGPPGLDHSDGVPMAGQEGSRGAGHRHFERSPWDALDPRGQMNAPGVPGNRNGGPQGWPYMNPNSHPRSRRQSRRGAQGRSRQNDGPGPPGFPGPPGAPGPPR